MRAVHIKGCLSIWSGAIDNAFERRLKQENLFFRRFHVAAYKGGKARSRCIWVIARDPLSLPPEQAGMESQGPAAIPSRPPRRGRRA